MKILDKIKSLIRRRLVHIEDNGDNMPVTRRFYMSGNPTDRAFLLESLMIHRVYSSTDPEITISSITSEDGTVEYNETHGYIEISLTEKQYDTRINDIGLKPIVLEQNLFMLEDGTSIQVCKVDSTFYYGSIEFTNSTVANKWKYTKSLKKHIVEDVTNREETSIINYWIKTRLNNKYTMLGYQPT